MANFQYTYAKAKMLSGDIDMDVDDIRMFMVMSNTTCDTEKDMQIISDGGTGFTTLDECDGVGYARVPLTGEAVAADEANDRGEFTADNLAPAWAALAVGTRQNVGIVIYKHVTNDTDSIPIYWIDTCTGVGFPFDGNGGVVNITWNAEGIGQIT
ncbi:MAG TPA: hypothetical protein VMW79_06115 [Anaerolineae bacterium]|nr:hypothetical protein [Anaerolineae bacterium]HUW95991.1 hypothetical protein [Anaerolineae bacterium]